MVQLPIGIRTLLICCLVCQYSALPQTVFADDDPKSKEVYQFSVEHNHHENPSQFYIISLGDGKSQKAQLTVYEILGQDITIRQLHQTELVNLSHPMEHILCGAGRFFLTFDEGYMWNNVRKTENLLVVYDLVRNEHTVYKFDDLFSDKFFVDRGEEPDAHLSFTDWRQRIGDVAQHFDPNNLTFRVPLPRSKIWFGQDVAARVKELVDRKPVKDKPIDYEIVIDLPTRIAKVQQAKEYVDIVLTKFVGDEDRQRGIGTQINASQGEVQPSRLPQFLRFWKFPGHRDLIFELDQSSLEYRKAAAEKWRDRSRMK